MVRKCTKVTCPPKWLRSPFPAAAVKKAANVSGLKHTMPVFVVHEHHAGQLHFDFRLEIDGVLASWAVPKGPSMNPAEKRLAIHVDDHELSYASFEGVIPKNQYGAGAVCIWDTGPFDLVSGNPIEGRIEFVLHGKKLNGAFVLVCMKGKRKEWLLIKMKDGHADSSFVMRPLHAK